MKLRYVDFEENVTKEACDEAWSCNAVGGLQGS